jgi:DNA-binding HxlR family transcriptional regulator
MIGPHTKIAILRYLAAVGEGRFCQTQRDLGLPSYSLARAFRALASDGLITCAIVAGTMTRNTRYRLTESGAEAVRELSERRSAA